MWKASPAALRRPEPILQDRRRSGRTDGHPGGTRSRDHTPKTLRPHERLFPDRRQRARHGRSGTGGGKRREAGSVHHVEPPRLARQAGHDVRRAPQADRRRQNTRDRTDQRARIPSQSDRMVQREPPRLHVRLGRTPAHHRQVRRSFCDVPMAFKSFS